MMGYFIWGCVLFCAITTLGSLVYVLAGVLLAFLSLIF